MRARDDVPGDGHPGFVLVSGNVVPVTWWEFVIFPGAGPRLPIWVR
jgi:hypothetical protein